jgi:hypothetical protein
MQSKSLRSSHTQVATYRDLENFVNAFARRCLNLVIIYGRPGVGKSWTVRNRLGNQAFTINGTASPFGIYIAAYEHRDEPIVLDDIDGLTASHQGIRLLKALAQTDAVKTVSWESQAPALSRRQIPRSFQTRSPLAILANSHFDSEDARALEDRGHVLEFDPSPREVHQKASTWFGDQEIFDFVGAYLNLLPSHSFRIYVKAKELKNAGLPWETAVLERCLSGKTLEVARLRCDRSFQSEAERARAFAQRGLGCRATYFNHVRQLPSQEPQDAAPRIVLASNPPPQLQLELKLNA